MASFFACNASIAAADDNNVVCEDARIRIRGSLHVKWRERVANACDTVRGGHETDPTARVRLSSSGESLLVEVVLQDGRSTVRRVDDPASLEATLDALLSLPPLVTKGATRDGLAPVDEVAAPNPVVTPPSKSLVASGVEVGGSVGGRVAGAGYLSFAPQAFAQARLGAWLLGMVVRWDVVQFKSDAAMTDFEMDTVAVGLFLDHRQVLPFGAFDVGASPRFVAETQSYLSKTGEVADTKIDVRLGGEARLVLGHSATRFYCALDAELSPARLRRDIRIDPALPVLPSWSAGISGGVIWGSP